MPGASVKILVGEATQRIHKSKGKGSKDISGALSPEKIAAVKGNEKQGKNR